jgi:hypothetical protein
LLSNRKSHIQVLCVLDPPLAKCTACTKLPTAFTTHRQEDAEERIFNLKLYKSVISLRSFN